MLAVRKQLMCIQAGRGREVEFVSTLNTNVEHTVPSQRYLPPFVPPVVVLEAVFIWEENDGALYRVLCPISLIPPTVAEPLPQRQHLICQSPMTNKFARECQYHRTSSQAAYHTDGKSSLPEAGCTGCQHFLSFFLFFSNGCPSSQCPPGWTVGAAVHHPTLTD